MWHFVKSHTLAFCCERKTAICTGTPSISLGTVYKNIKVFVDGGLVREVSPLYDTLRLDANLEPHHHLIWTSCKKVEDLPAEGMAPVRFRGRLPKGFQPKRTMVEVIGFCPACAPNSQ